MSRKARRSGSVRDSGPRPGTEINPTLAAASQFDAALTQAALDNSVGNKHAPYAHIQTIVPGSNYSVKANTAESHARIMAAKQGVDPALNRRFETATEAMQYRRANNVVAISGDEFDAETSGKGSSSRFPAWLQDTGGIDPDTGRAVKGYKGAEAFRMGEKIMSEMGY